MTNTITQAGRTHLRFALTDGVGPILFRRLLEQFGSADRAMGRTAAELQAVRGIGRGADTVASAIESVKIEPEIEAACELGVRIVCRDDAEYPPGLQQIPDAPIVLYVRGELRTTDAVALAIVGSRRCTIYGSEQARRFGELLTRAGLTVVSGLARGVDAFAHHGAVDSGGRSIAVLGNGLHEIYPPENKPLADKLVEQGALISELPIRTPVRSTNFPSRNRIIAGMSLGTLVVEAAARSGALITARLASEYNREVFALPGRVQDPMSIGTNMLIRDGGAKLVTCLEDILDELGDVGRTFQPAAAVAQSIPTPSLFAPPVLDATEAHVLAQISADPISHDSLVRAAQREPGAVLAALTALELKGLVRRVTGNQFVRRPPR
jgi:DNA processing protein